VNLSVLGSSSFVLGLQSLSCTEVNQSSETKLQNSVTPEKDYITPFLKITNHGDIIIVVPVPEIGQGVRTSLPLLVAEELDLNLENVIVEQGVADSRLGGMAAAGSDSISDYFQLMRKAGATAREMLKRAASIYWKEPVENISIKNGLAFLKDTNKQINWKELLPEMESMGIPSDIKLKARESYEFKDDFIRNTDIDKIINGTAIYGLDVRLENMKYASVARCPVYKGKYKDYNSVNALKIPGVIEIVEIPSFIPGEDKYAEVVGGIAVIADNTWTAMKGKEALDINWELGDQTNKNSTSISIDTSNPLTTLREKGSSESINESPIAIESTYEFPMMAHVCMEPMNFTAHITEEEAFLTGPTQVPRFIQEFIAGIFKIPKNKVTVLPTLAGGGFGRRLAIDYALEAAVISKRAGYPVQVVWTREEDIQHDFYRTAAIHKLKAQFEGKNVNSWNHEIYTQPIGDGPIYEVQGAADIPLKVPNIKISWGELKSSVRIGSWRSVAHSHNSFVINSWIDELANVQKVDTVQMIMDLIGSGSGNITTKLPIRGWRGNVTINLGRLKNVIEKVTQNANLVEKLPPGIGKGLAFSVYKNAYSAHISKVKVKSGQVEVMKVTGVLDCGEVVHLEGVKAQMEGSIMDGISTVFFNEITYESGKIKQSNFDNLHWSRMAHSPQMDLKVIDSKEAPRGAGEPTYPSVAPSIANAIYAASGIRLYRLPASHYGLKLKS